MSDWLSEYIANNYGTCKLTHCECRDQHRPRFGGSWVGRQCPDWLPVSSKNWDEFKIVVYERYMK